MRPPGVLEWRRVAGDLEEPLAEFFESIGGADRDLFHPHPFDREEARKLAHYEGADLYYVLVEGRRVLSYGMLRGWDEGFEVPSLGILVNAEVRGVGLGELTMRFLHLVARRRRAPRVRLTVYERNARAIALYKSLGYRFGEPQDGRLIGFLELS